jgi:hypothetical protein
MAPELRAKLKDGVSRTAIITEFVDRTDRHFKERSSLTSKVNPAWLRVGDGVSGAPSRQQPIRYFPHAMDL